MEHTNHCGHKHFSIEDRIAMDQQWATVVLGGRLEISETLMHLITKSRFILAADGGLDHLMKMEILPSILVGDFDSLSEEALAWSKEKEIIKESYPQNKDRTDGEIALDRTIQEGFTHIFVLGSSGDFRPDHFLSILQYCLHMHKRFGITFVITDGKNYYFPILGPTEKRIDMNHFYTQESVLDVKVSLIPWSPLNGLSYEGLIYGGEIMQAQIGTSRFVSNQVKPGEDSFTIRLESGEALLILSLE